LFGAGAMGASTKLFLLAMRGSLVNRNSP